MVRALSHFLEFCYLARRDVLDEDALAQMETALGNFHCDRIVFEHELGHSGRTESLFSLPRQHSLNHYIPSIREFGSPNGLCTSITESKHIKAVKEPWRRSSRYNALGQMLLTNQRIDKLSAARVDFTARGMLNGPLFTAGLVLNGFKDGSADDVEEQGLQKPPEEDGAIEGPRVLGEVKLAKKPGMFLYFISYSTLLRGIISVPHYPRALHALAAHIRQPQLSLLIRRFLYGLEHPDCDDPSLIDPVNYPPAPSNARVFPSARAIYFAPSDHSGVGGMHWERIRSVRSWRKGPPRRDCVFVSKDPDTAGFMGLNVARVHLFFSFKYKGEDVPCALIHWFSAVGDSPCDSTGMWVVEPDKDPDSGNHVMDIIHIDAIFRCAHLIPVYGDKFIPWKDKVNFANSLDLFKSFYVNKYADHHAHEIAF